MTTKGKKKKAPAKRAAKTAKVQKATFELTRGQAYALLAGVSAAMEHGVVPPEDMQADLYAAVTKFRRAFKFKQGDKY